MYHDKGGCISVTMGRSLPSIILPLQCIWGTQFTACLNSYGDPAFASSYRPSMPARNYLQVQIWNGRWSSSAMHRQSCLGGYQVWTYQQKRQMCTGLYTFGLNGIFKSKRRFLFNVYLCGMWLTIKKYIDMLMKFVLFTQGKWEGKTKDLTHIQVWGKNPKRAGLITLIDGLCPIRAGFGYSRIEKVWSNITQGFTVLLHVSLYAPSIPHLTGNPLASKCNCAALARLNLQVIKTEDSEDSNVVFTGLKTTLAHVYF